MSKVWTVWVGGGEVNDYLLDYDSALKIAQDYLQDGYDEVVIEKVGE
jgi:hypothetical protein